jgi:translocator protein
VNAKPRKDRRAIVIAAVAATLVAMTGGLLTKLGPWYYALAKPAWQPPDWAFGPAWTIIFALCAVAGAIAWREAAGAGERRLVLAAFAINAVLNVSWSYLFFTMQRPDLALVEVGILWLSVLGLVLVLRRSSTRAAWLVVPYLAWVSFAAFLNFTLVKLNPGIGA